jgi:DNA-damage-inducible protein J
MKFAMYHARDTFGTRKKGADMGKTAYITARIEPKLKAQAGRVLAKVGVSTTDAITMFMRQVVLHEGLPFEVRVPNAETRKAIEEIKAGGGEVFHASTKEVFDSLIEPRKKRNA